MQTFGLKDEHIKLGQLLKATGLVGLLFRKDL